MLTDMLSKEVIGIMSRSRLLGKELVMKYYFSTDSILLSASDSIVCIEAPFLNDAFVYNVYGSTDYFIFGCKDNFYGINIRYLLDKFELYSVTSTRYRSQVRQGGVCVIDNRLKWRIEVCLNPFLKIFESKVTNLVFHVDVLNPDNEIGVFVSTDIERDIDDLASGAMPMTEFRLVEKTSKSICEDPFINTVDIRYFTLEDFIAKREYYNNISRVRNLVCNIDSLYYIDSDRVTKCVPGGRSV